MILQLIKDIVILLRTKELAMLVHADIAINEAILVSVGDIHILFDARIPIYRHKLAVGLVLPLWVRNVNILHVS